MTELEMRQSLFVHDLAEYTNDPDTLVVEELGILQGATRVDIAVLNGCFSAYEIKSPSDRLARLPHQVDLYNRVFDRVTLVVSENHRVRALDLLPEWWAIAVATGDGVGVRVAQDRHGDINPCPDPHAIARLLWREEALALLVERHADHGVRTKPRKHLWDQLCEAYTPSELKHAVLEHLKARPGWPATRRQRSYDGSCI